MRISKKEVTLIRTEGDEPVALDGDGKPLTELHAEIIGTGNKVNLDKLTPGIDRMKSTKQGYLRFVTDPDVPFGLFFLMMTEVSGTPDLPIAREMYLAPIN